MKTDDQDKTLYVLAYTSAGLGHLRVTQALYDAAPKNIHPVLFRAQAGFTTGLHKLSSSNERGISFMEWTQKGIQEEVLTRAYTFLLRRTGFQIASALNALLQQEFTVFKKVVVISTHFGLAHQIGSQKKYLSKKLGLEVSLVVCVTDASPQKLWVVPGADITFVPSQEVSDTLSRYANSRSLIFNPVVNPYPLHPAFSWRLKKAEYQVRKKQLDPGSRERIQVLIPISGAAVGISFYEDLILRLFNANKRFHFYVVAREDSYTHDFIERMRKYQFVSLVTAADDRDVILYYSQLLATSIFSFEITKPSEQSFKALISPKCRGGVFLLFTEPVGRQEHDNLSFLKTHELLGKRAFTLPPDSRESAEFILKWLADKSFLNELSTFKAKVHANPETEATGSRDFWKLLTEKQ